jgi:hypothetical protein
MANSQTYVDGFGGGSQITTLAEVQGAGLKLPTPTADFINIRSPGKIERLFTANGNSNTLYTTNKPQDLYLKGPISTANFDYRSIEQGQRNKLTTTFEASRRDARRVTKFLSSSAGTRFILKQLVLQGFQPHDETKVYNPSSPIIAALRLASFGALDRPTRHLDTSNIIGGLLGGTGLGSVTRTVGGLFGGGGSTTPSPPRSSVASEASRGLGSATFTSFLGGGDRSDQVVSPLARPDVKDLLRGQTATNAYNAPRYNKLVSGGGGSFFGRLLSGTGKFLQNNTVIGGILPAKQPWAAKYRADEQTYDLYLNSGKLFNPDQTGIGGGGILSGVLNAVGFGKKANYSQSVRQRFYNQSKNSPNFNRSIVVGRINRYTSNVESTDETAKKYVGETSQITTSKVSGKDGTLKYTDLINVSDEDFETSDQLLNYKSLTDNTKNFSDTFVDAQSQVVKDTVQTYINTLKSITGADPVTNGRDQYKYNIGLADVGELMPSQFQKWVGKKDEVGFNYLKQVKSSKNSKSNPTTDLTYDGRFKRGSVVPTRTKRQIEPTNDVDYVNSLEVLSEDQFDELYLKNGGPYGRHGPDIVKFYFYDIVNQKYIPFRATVKGIQDTNTAEWEPIEYLGRPDKQYYYKGFTREVGFNFVVNAHSIKELMPMWQRINYLVGLTRPSNYTEQAGGGFMIPPMVQLTFGDFFKNHFVVIKNCNVSIPDDASWEVISEEYSGDWSFGVGFGGAIKWGSGGSINNSMDGNTREKIKDGSRGRFAQFPRTVEINMQMSVLEKDRAKSGRAIWGNAVVRNVDGVDIYGSYSQQTGTVTLDGKENFSNYIRYDTDIAEFVNRPDRPVNNINFNNT